MTVLAPLPSHPRLGCLLFMASLPKTPLDFYTKMPTLKGLLDPFLGASFVFFKLSPGCVPPHKKKGSTPRPADFQAAPIGHCYIGARMRQRRILSTHLKGRWGNDITAMGPPDQWDGKNTPIYSCVEIILISGNI